jgi:hypothetical protein
MNIDGAKTLAFKYAGIAVGLMRGGRPWKFLAEL